MDDGRATRPWPNELVLLEAPATSCGRYPHK